MMTRSTMNPSESSFQERFFAASEQLLQDRRRGHELIELPDGFRIEHRYRRPVTVRLQPWVFSITADDGGTKNLDLLCPIRKLVRELADELLDLPGHSQAGSKQSVREAWNITPAVHAQRQRLSTQIDPSVLCVQQNLLDICGHVPALARSPAFYTDPFLPRDVQQYRAATIALAFLETQLFDDYARRRLGGCRASMDALVAAMANWRGLFSPDGVAYRSLNRTLMNVPAEVPPALLCHLRNVRLERPIVDALELTTVLLVVAGAGEHGGAERLRNRLRLFQHAGAPQIGAAVVRIGAATRRHLHTGSVDDLRFALRFLADDPEMHGTTLAGVTEHAIRWHREAPGRRQAQEVLSRVGGGQRPTQPPPIPLPDIAGIRFLATTGEVVAEGTRMNHCIGSRAASAVLGKCYLFHVDYRGEMASIEVSATGRITESAGPHNSKNAAVTWGCRKLLAWAKPLRPQRRRRLPAGPDPNQFEFPFPR
jgi:hypothetical protein